MKKMDTTLLAIQWRSETGLLYWRREPGEPASEGWVVSPQSATCFHVDAKDRDKAEEIADRLAVCHKGAIDVIEVEVVIDFTCRVCGIECDVAPNPPGRAVCEAHCPDHNYEYDRWERKHLCTICSKIRPE